MARWPDTTACTPTRNSCSPAFLVNSPATSAPTVDVDAHTPGDRPPLRPRIIAGKHAQPLPSRRRRQLVVAIPLAAALVAAGYLAEHGLFARNTTQHAPAPVGSAAPETPTTPSNGLSPGEFVPSRTWGWAPQHGADAYEVTFYLNGRVVLHARSKDNRLVLPRRFRFQAGRYRWTVQPVPSVAEAPPIADSSFTLTPAAAAAANK